MKPIYKIAISLLAAVAVTSAYSQNPNGWAATHGKGMQMKKKYGENWALRSIDLTKSIMTAMNLTPDQRMREQKLRDQFDARIDMVVSGKVRDPQDKKPVEIKELAHDFNTQMMAILTPVQQKEFHKRWSNEMRMSKMHRPA